MSTISVLLLVTSAVLHAGWNLSSKSIRPSAAFFLLTSIAGAALLSPSLALFSHALNAGIPLKVWLLLAATGFFMALYYISLAAAYRAGDMSVAYPLARSSPVIIVMTITLLLGRSSQVSIACMLGIILVVGGSFLLPMQWFGGFRLHNYLDATCGWALLTAIGTSGYSLLDDEALRCLRGEAATPAHITGITLVYACLEALITSIWLALFVLFRKEGRLLLKQVFRRSKWTALFTGLAIHLTYAIVLLSMAFVKNVSYVVAFRQLSIPLGVILAIIILREPPYKPKLAGVAIMFAGLLLVAIR